MKGMITDLIFVMVIILIVGIALISIKTVHTDLSATNQFNATFMAESGSALGTLGGAMIFIAVGFICAMVILAATINAHPVFAVAMMIIMVFIVILAAIVSNVFGTFSTDSHMAEAASTMPETTTMFTHLPLIMLVACIVVIIALFAKGGGQP